MKLTSIPFSSYTIEETDQLGREIRQKLQLKFADNKLIMPIIDELGPKLEDAQKAIGSTTKQLHTDAIRETDRDFNRYFIGFRAIINGYTNSPSQKEKEASELLSEILEKNDDKLYTSSYAEQDAKYNSLKTDLSTPAAASALGTLHMVAWDTAMSETIATIARLTAERDKDESSKDVPTNKEAKLQLQTVINNAIEDLHTYTRRNSVDNLGMVLAEIDQLIKRLNANARARNTRKRNDTE